MSWEKLVSEDNALRQDESISWEESVSHDKALIGERSVMMNKSMSQDNPIIPDKATICKKPVSYNGSIIPDESVIAQMIEATTISGKMIMTDKISIKISMPESAIMRPTKPGNWRYQQHPKNQG